AANASSVANSSNTQGTNDILEEVDNGHDEYGWLGDSWNGPDLYGFEENLDCEDEGDYASDVDNSEETDLVFTFGISETTLPSDAIVPTTDTSTATDTVPEAESQPCRLIENQNEQGDLLTVEILEAELVDYDWIKSTVDDETIRFIEAGLRSSWPDPNYSPRVFYVPQ
ncbi:hypothetical protein BGZ76_006181, partial [Entomortierella beljakovae]